MNHAILPTALLLFVGTTQAQQLLWTTTDNQINRSVGRSQYQPTATWEAADDFFTEGEVTRIVGVGGSCFGCQPPNVTGVYVRFYEWTASGPGTLLYEEYFPEGHPNFVHSATPGSLDVTLVTPFEADGWYFFSVQIGFDPGGLWEARAANFANPVNSPAYVRSSLDGNVWEPVVHAGGGGYTSDSSFEIYGNPSTSSIAIDSITPPATTHSGRIFVEGLNFGPEQLDAEILIDGRPAVVSRWENTGVAAYVPEATPTGTVEVVVSRGGSTSNAFPIEVAPRSPDGRLIWRFDVEGDYMLHRPGIGDDGTVYINDQYGGLYGVTADGGLLWLVDTLEGQQGSGTEGPVEVTPDGTIIVASNPLGPLVSLHGYNPDGSHRWTYNDDATSVGVGPGVGPDGNVYIAFSDIGRQSQGLVSLTESGEYMWNNPGDPALYEHGALGAELAFASSVSGGPRDRIIFTMDRDSSRRVWSFSLDGQQDWAFDPGGINDSVFMQHQLQVAAGDDGQFYMSESRGWGLRVFDVEDHDDQWLYHPMPMSGAGAPEVGPDGTVYYCWNGGFLAALDSDGDEKWLYDDAEGFDTGPIASPDGSQVAITGGSFGASFWIKGIDAQTGDVLWTHNLGMENGEYIRTTNGRVRWSDDSSTAYVSVSVSDPNFDGSNQYCSIYAIDATANCEADWDDDNTLNSGDFLAYLNDYNAVRAGGTPTYGDPDLAAPFGSMSTADFLEFLNLYALGCDD